VNTHVFSMPLGAEPIFDGLGAIQHRPTLNIGSRGLAHSDAEMSVGSFVLTLKGKWKRTRWRPKRD